ncbi:heterogeneous nuclear ribonucleoprotein A3 homolog 1-like [Battus philenor]|uniref:heterogeneous nuclear ribonucleoprotein A3 homolog 1-like n=1 Tax=Battus philenor TaxID=42288 RepID=UPI0035D11C93
MGVDAGTRVIRSPQFGFSEANAQARSYGGGDPYNYHHHHHHHGPDFGGYGGGYGGRGFGGRGFGGGPGYGYGGGPGNGYGGGPGYGFGGNPGYGQIPGGSISISKSVSINAGPGGAAQSSAKSGAYGK